MANKFDIIRNKIMEDVSELLANPYGAFGYEVLETGSNEICVPIVNEDHEEGYLVITFKIPKGSRDGEPYDGYAVAQDFKMKCDEKARKVAEAQKKKAEKIERDRKVREEKAKLKAEKKD